MLAGDEALSKYRLQSEDTSIDVERFLIERYRAMSPAQKIHIFRELSRASQEFALAGIRGRFPAADAHELRMRAAATRLTPGTMKEAFGWSDSMSTET